MSSDDTFFIELNESINKLAIEQQKFEDRPPSPSTQTDWAGLEEQLEQANAGIKSWQDGRWEEYDVFEQAKAEWRSVERTRLAQERTQAQLDDEQAPVAFDDEEQAEGHLSRREQAYDEFGEWTAEQRAERRAGKQRASTTPRRSSSRARKSTRELFSELPGEQSSDDDMLLDRVPRSAQHTVVKPTPKSSFYKTNCQDDRASSIAEEFEDDVAKLDRIINELKGLPDLSQNELGNMPAVDVDELQSVPTGYEDAPIELCDTPIPSTDEEVGDGLHDTGSELEDDGVIQRARPTTSGVPARDARAPNRGKKNRQPIEFPFRVWIPGSDGRERWQKLEVLDEGIQIELLHAFQQASASSNKVKSLYASWTDPANIHTHYDNCIAHGLRIKVGQWIAANYRACEWCEKRSFLCASLHEGVRQGSAFIGILPLPPRSRMGVGINELAYWIAGSA
ncbi:hypothetical protein NX059_009777 [Plenodomus lindquistii]|nr:hypothetical protein NX059_009777 [Plenodomus lindquistii]